MEILLWHGMPVQTNPAHEDLPYPWVEATPETAAEQPQQQQQQQWSKTRIDKMCIN